MFAKYTPSQYVSPFSKGERTFYFSFKYVKGIGNVVTNINPSGISTKMLPGACIIQHYETGKTPNGYGLVKAASVSSARVYVEKRLLLPL